MSSSSIMLCSTRRFSSGVASSKRFVVAFSTCEIRSLSKMPFWFTSAT
jgi:hypothetical protein